MDAAKNTEVYFEFDRPVPDDDGYIVIPVSSAEGARLRIVELFALDSTSGVKLGTPTARLRAGIPTPVPKAEELTDQFKNKNVRLYLSHYGPEVPRDSEKEDVKKIRGVLNRIRQ